jgi:hypothetical protein
MILYLTLLLLLKDCVSLTGAFGTSGERCASVIIDLIIHLMVITDHSGFQRKEQLLVVL